MNRDERVSKEIGIRAAVTAMFGNLKARWRQARGAQLKRQFENATRWADDLGDEQAERFGRGLNHLFNDWVKDLVRSRSAMCGPESSPSGK